MVLSPDVSIGANPLTIHLLHSQYTASICLFLSDLRHFTTEVNTFVVKYFLLQEIYCLFASQSN